MGGADWTRGGGGGGGGGSGRSRHGDGDGAGGGGGCIRVMSWGCFSLGTEQG